MKEMPIERLRQQIWTQPAGENQDH
jgi:hypothetical protein